MIVDGMNLISGSGVVGGIVALATTLGWWLRRERVEAAKTNTIIAGMDATTSTYESQQKEIEVVRERLTKMESAYVAQAALVGELMKKISELEARMVGASSHYDNLILCELCLEKNERVLEALNKTLKNDHGH